MTENLLRVDILEALSVLALARNENEDLDLSTLIDVARSGPVVTAGFDYDGALAAIDICGEALLSKPVSRVELFRTILKCLIRSIKPLWLSAFVSGREAVLDIVPVNVRQCLSYADLSNNELDRDAIRWWDDLASDARKLRDESLLETGRLGEELTLRYETDKLEKLGLALSPKWVAIDDNNAGYDVLSYRIIGNCNGNLADETLIEVKASSYSPPSFFLTRKEWDVASRNRFRYFVHVWTLPDSKLREIGYSQLAMHVPDDNGQGKWQTFKVSLDD